MTTQATTNNKLWCYTDEVKKKVTNYCIRFGHSLWSVNQLQGVNRVFRNLTSSRLKKCCTICCKKKKKKKKKRKKVTSTYLCCPVSRGYACLCMYAAWSTASLSTLVLVTSRFAVAAPRTGPRLRELWRHWVAGERRANERVPRHRPPPLFGKRRRRLVTWRHQRRHDGLHELNDPYKPSSIHRRGKTRPADLRSPHDHSSFVARRFVRAWPRREAPGVFLLLRSACSVAFGYARAASARLGFLESRSRFGPSIPGQVAFDPEGTLASDGCDSAALTNIRTANPKLPEFYRGNVDRREFVFIDLCIRQNRIVQFCCRELCIVNYDLSSICICRGYLGLNSLTRFARYSGCCVPLESLNGGIIWDERCTQHLI